LIRVISNASLWNFSEIIRLCAVNIFRRGEDKNSIRLHHAQQIHGAFDVCAKTVFRFGGISAEMSREVNHHVVSAGPSCVERAEDIEMRPPRKVFGVKKPAEVSAEITAAACD
jgi:hypothetical protein